MILRWAVAGLLAANLLYFFWSRFGEPAPGARREPERLQLQIRPDSVRILPPGIGTAPPAAGPPLAAAKSAAAAAPPPPAPAPAPAPAPPPPATAVTEAAASAPAAGALVCLETEPLPPATMDGAEQALAAVLPGRSWIRASRETSALYAVVIGPMSSRESMLNKREELGRIRIGGEEVRLTPNGGPALALGRYDSQAGAQAGLQSFSQRGVKTARVVALRQPLVEMRLRVEGLNTEQADALRALKAPALGAAGLVPCSLPPTR